MFSQMRLVMQDMIKRNNRGWKMYCLPESEEVVWVNLDNSKPPIGEERR